jgi:hypothetical protein
MGIPRLPLTTYLPYPSLMDAVVELHEKRPALPEKLKELQTKGKRIRTQPFLNYARNRKIQGRYQDLS